MDLPFPSFPVLLTAFLLLLTLIIKRLRTPNSKTTNLPISPWKLPIIGNLHQLLTGRPEHGVMRDISRSYDSDIILLKLGQVDHIVVSSLEAAKELLQNHDVNFASRPRLLAPDIIAYRCTDVAFSPYGSYWRQVRKICTLELFSARRVKESLPLMQREISRLVDYIAGTGFVNLTEQLLALNNRTITMIACGTKCEHQERLISGVKKAISFVNGLYVSDLFPSLRFIEALSGARSCLEKIHRDMDETLDVIIEEHRRCRGRGEDQNDLVNVLLGIQEEGDLGIQLTMANIKAVILVSVHTHSTF